MTQTRKSTPKAHGRRLGIVAIGLLIAVFAALASIAYAGEVNGRIAFSSDRTGIVSIWSMDPDGTGATQLTFPGTKFQDWWPVVSPSGRRIVFTRYDFTSAALGSEALYIMNADGSHIRRLSQQGGNFDDNVADFSPDGHTIAFISDRNDPNRLTNICRHAVGAPGCNWDLYTMNTDGTGQRQLTSDPGADSYPEFAPHGHKLMFSSTRSGSMAVYTMNRDGSAVSKLTPDAMQAGDSNWSPDGSKITLINNFCICAFNSDVFTMNADGTGVTQLTSNYGTSLEPEYSPDGTKIAFANFAPVSSTSCCGPGDIVVMNSADGSGKTNLNNSPTIDDETPGWGPVPSGLDVGL